MQSRLYYDTRIEGDEQLYMRPPPDSVYMIIPEAFLECVCFLCLKPKNRNGPVHMFGTAFFVGTKAESGGENYSNHAFLVTARHNLTDAKAEIKANPKKWEPHIFARINSDDG